MCDRDRGWLLDELLRRVEVLEGKKVEQGPYEAYAKAMLELADGVLGGEGGVYMTHEQWRQLAWAETKPKWWRSIREVAAEIHGRAVGCAELGELHRWSKQLFDALGLKPHLPEGCHVRSARSASSPGNVTGHFGMPKPEPKFQRGDVVQLRYGNRSVYLVLGQAEWDCESYELWGVPPGSGAAFSDSARPEELILVARPVDSQGSSSTAPTV